MKLSDELARETLSPFLFEGGTLDLLSARGTPLWTSPVPNGGLTLSGRAVTLAAAWTARAHSQGQVAGYRLSEGKKSMEGTVTADGGGGDMEIDDVNVLPGKLVTIVAFSVAI